MQIATNVMGNAGGGRPKATPNPATDRPGKVASTKKTPARKPNSIVDGRQVPSAQNGKNVSGDQRAGGRKIVAPGNIAPDSTLPVQSSRNINGQYHPTRKEGAGATAHESEQTSGGHQDAWIGIVNRMAQNLTQNMNAGNRNPGGRRIRFPTAEDEGSDHQTTNRDNTNGSTPRGDQNRGPRSFNDIRDSPRLQTVEKHLEQMLDQQHRISRTLVPSGRDIAPPNKMPAPHVSRDISSATRGYREPRLRQGSHIENITNNRRPRPVVSDVTSRQTTTASSVSRNESHSREKRARSTLDDRIQMMMAFEAAGSGASRVQGNERTSQCSWGGPPAYSQINRLDRHGEATEGDSLRRRRRPEAQNAIRINPEWRHLEETLRRTSRNAQMSHFRSRTPVSLSQANQFRTGFNCTRPIRSAGDYLSGGVALVRNAYPSNEAEVIDVDALRSGTPAEEEVILISDSEPEASGDRSPAHRQRRSRSQRPSQPPPVPVDGETGFDDVSIVSHVIRGAGVALTETDGGNNASNSAGLSSNIDGDNGDELSVVAAKRGLQALVDLPHMRFQCGNIPFVSGKRRKTCPMCYCFICDIPASKCGKWDSHSSATDKNPQAVKKRRKTREKQAKNTS